MIQVELPWPPGQLRPNVARRTHWRSNSTAAALYKSLCAMDLRPQIDKAEFGSVPISLTIQFCPPSRRKYDRDGSLSSIKAGLDALAAHLGMDDDDFEPITLRRGPVVKGGKVVITLMEGE